MTDTQAPDAVTEALKRRFWEKVERRERDQCWLWLGSKNERGYGSMSHNKRLRKATHLAFEIHHMRPFPIGMVARHTCDNPSCVNPQHIVPGTLRQNAQDMVERKRHHANRRTHCIKGHPLSGENLIHRKNGQRGCRECNKAHQKNYKRKVRSKSHEAAI